MGTTFKTVSGKIYVETEEELDVSDCLNEIGLVNVMNHFDHSEILEGLPYSLIIEKAKELHTFTVEEMLENYSLSELKTIVAQELLSR
jgi:hypothetical protein